MTMISRNGDTVTLQLDANTEATEPKVLLSGYPRVDPRSSIPAISPR